MTTWVNQHQKHSTILAGDVGTVVASARCRWPRQQLIMSFYSVKQRHKWYLTKSAPKRPHFSRGHIQQQRQPFNGHLSGTTWVGRYQKKHSPAHTHPGQHSSFITFLHLQRSTASSLFSLRAWQSSRTTSFQVLLGLEPSTSYSMHFFTQSSSSFHSTCPYQRSLFCCNINAMSSTPSLSLSSLLGSLSFSLTPQFTCK